MGIEQSSHPSEEPTEGIDNEEVKKEKYDPGKDTQAIEVWIRSHVEGKLYDPYNSHGVQIGEFVMGEYGRDLMKQSFDNSFDRFRAEFPEYFLTPEGYPKLISQLETEILFNSRSEYGRQGSVDSCIRTIRQIPGDTEQILQDVKQSISAREQETKSQLNDILNEIDSSLQG